MANLYLRSTDGVDTDNGSTWALAKATLVGAGSAEAAGDRIWVSQSHTEVCATSIYFDGSPTNPTYICGVNDTSGEPPTTLQAGAAFNVGADIFFTGTVYWKNIRFFTSSGTLKGMTFNKADPGYPGGYMLFEDCVFQNSGTGSDSRWYVHGNPGTSANVFESWTKFKNCTFRAASNNSNTISLNGKVWFEGCSIASGYVASSQPFISVRFTTASDVRLDGCDLSLLGSSQNIIGSSGGLGKVVLTNCKFPSSWTGLLCNPLSQYHGTVEAYNCDSGATNYKMWIVTHWGTIKSQTTVYNDAGASDGTTRIAWEMVTRNDTIPPLYPFFTLDSPPILVWNDTTGAAKTLTVEIVHNSQGTGTNGALKDDEIWLEASYLGSSAAPLGSFAYDSKATVISTAADQDTSSASWTGDSAGWDTQKLNVTVTPNMKGWFAVVVKIAKPSITVYVDPLVTVT